MSKPRVEPATRPPGLGEVVYSFVDPAAGRSGPMRVFAYLPKAVERGTPTPVLFVLHGVKRDAEEEFRRIVPPSASREELLPEKFGFVLLVPEFTTALFPGRNGYNFGGVFEDEKGARVRQRDAWAFSAIDRMFAAVCSSIGLVSPGFHLFGHSAGAQFVHRYLAFTSTSLGRDCAGDVEERRLLLACSANAGAYLMPSWAEDFPFGLRGLEGNFTSQDLEAFLGAPLMVLLGAKDTDPNHKHLARDEAAQRQGPHRLARGQTFFEEGRALASRLGVPFAWTLAVVPEVGHLGTRMLRAFVSLQFGDGSQDTAHAASCSAARL